MLSKPDIGHPEALAHILTTPPTDASIAEVPGAVSDLGHRAPELLIGLGCPSRMLWPLRIMSYG